MKLFTKIKISYALIFIIPLTLIALTIGSMGSRRLNDMSEKYDVEGITYEVLYNPFKMFGQMTTTVINELEHIANTDPKSLENVAYLEEINKKLKTYSSAIVVRRDGVNIYQGVDKSVGFNTDIVYNAQSDADEGIYVLGQVPYHIKQLSFKYTSGADGQILIYTNMQELMPATKDILFSGLLLILMILFLSSVVAILWLYRSIVPPIEKLKVAADNIRDGNLDFNVVAEANDEIGQLSVAFEEMRIKLKEQIDISMQYEKDNKELLSNISHDLKTPITAIKGYVEGIRDGVADTPEKMDKYIKTIYNKAADMDKLIDELFLFSKLDSNSLNYTFKKINLNDYFEDCIEEVSLDLESKNIELGFFNYTDKDIMIVADPEQLKRVISNIINNSVKYIDKTKGIINVRITEEPEFVQIQIEDNGKGIASKELPYIFDRCYRTDASRNSAQGGSGLGLSIAKKIIEEHGGKIWATSKENIGTVMHFVLRKYKET